MGSSMSKTYPHKLSTRVNSLWDTLKITLMLDGYLTKRLRSMLAGEPLPRIARGLCLVLLAGLFVFSNTTNAIAVSTQRDKENYKLYAHIKLLNAKQYRCLEILWNRESRWDPRADNPKSSAFGIPQLLKMTELDPFKQIDLGLKYISKRHSTPCKALDYHNKKGHY
jgi:hypothetical protein